MVMPDDQYTSGDGWTCTIPYVHEVTASLVPIHLNWGPGADYV